MKKIFLPLLIFCSIVVSAQANQSEKIAYSHLVNDYWQIWVMDTDGSHQRQLTFSAFDKRNPVWTNDGKNILFRTNNGEAFLFNLDNQSEVEVLENCRDMNNPSISPKTGEIIFARMDPRGKDIGDIWKTNIKGDKTQVLTRDSVGKFQPSYSPSGNHVVFVKADLGKKSSQIWLMDQDGGSPEQITTGLGFKLYPSISLDEQTIVYSSNQNENNFEIYSQNFKTKKIQQLTHSAGLDTQPIFSSDGELIVFVSDRSGSQQLWLMKKDGTDIKPLTNSTAESIDPAWGRK